MVSSRAHRLRVSSAHPFIMAATPKIRKGIVPIKATEGRSGFFNICQSCMMRLTVATTPKINQRLPNSLKLYLILILYIIYILDLISVSGYSILLGLDIRCLILTKMK